MTATQPPLTYGSTYTGNHHHGAMIGTALPTTHTVPMTSTDDDNNRSTVPPATCSRVHTDGHHNGTMMRVALPTAFIMSGATLTAYGMMTMMMSLSLVAFCCSPNVIDTLIYFIRSPNVRARANTDQITLYIY